MSQADWGAATMEDVRPEPPRPLMRELPPADPFPIDALGDVLGAAAHAIHDRMQAPIAIGGQSVLAAATLAVQGHADVLLPIGGGTAKPVSCFFVTVAATGERKSACDTEATWPIRRHETALRATYDRELPAYENDKAAWDTAREAARKAGKGNRAAIREALNTLGPAPTPPLMPMLTCPEPTFEGLCKLYAYGQPSLGVFAAEGGQFIGGHGMSEDNKLKTAAGFSSVWDRELDPPSPQRRRCEQSIRPAAGGASDGATRSRRYPVPRPPPGRTGDPVAGAGDGPR